MSVDNIKEAIKTAIQMEKDGYSFYKKAAAQTNNNLARDIYENLAEDEENHLDVFQKIFEDKISKEEWNSLVESSKKYAKINIFPKDLKKAEGVSVEANELDALRMGMDAEKEAIDYYSKIMDEIEDEEIIKILEQIIEQEKNHYNILEGEFDHLNKTGYWYELDYLGGQNF